MEITLDYEKEIADFTHWASFATNLRIRRQALGFKDDRTQKEWEAWLARARKAIPDYNEDIDRTNVLTTAYLVMIQMSHGKAEEPRVQHALALLRDALAEVTGKTSQETQDSFERKAFYLESIRTA